MLPFIRRHLNAVFVSSTASELALPTAEVEETELDEERLGAALLVRQRHEVVVGDEQAEVEGHLELT